MVKLIDFFDKMDAEAQERYAPIKLYLSTWEMYDLQVLESIEDVHKLLFPDTIVDYKRTAVMFDAFLKRNVPEHVWNHLFVHSQCSAQKCNVSQKK